MKLISNGFTTKLPEGWEDRTMTTLVGAIGSSGFASNIVITRETVSPQTSVEGYAAEQRAAMEAELPDVQVLDERATNVNGAAAFQRLHRFAIEDENLQQVQTFILTGNTIFVVTMTATINDFDSQLPAVREVVDNFRSFKPEQVSI